MEEYQERDVILSDVVTPQTDPAESSTKRDPADPRPSLLCTRAIPAADYPPAPLRDTADCSPADVAPVTYLDLADRSQANFAPTILRDPPIARLLSTHGGLRTSWFLPLSQLASLNPGELITNDPLIDVSAPALSSGGVLVRPGVVPVVTCRVGVDG